MSKLLIPAALAGSIAASGAIAGGYESPVMEQPVVVEEAAAPSLGSVSPYVAVGAAAVLVALVASDSSSDSSD